VPFFDHQRVNSGNIDDVPYCSFNLQIEFLIPNEHRYYCRFLHFLPQDTKHTPRIVVLYITMTSCLGGPTTNTEVLHVPTRASCCYVLQSYHISQFATNWAIRKQILQNRRRQSRAPYTRKIAQYSAVAGCSLNILLKTLRLCRGSQSCVCSSGNMNHVLPHESAPLSSEATISLFRTISINFSVFSAISVIVFKN
jgi:hypothetical protein